MASFNTNLIDKDTEKNLFDKNAIFLFGYSKVNCLIKAYENNNPCRNAITALISQLSELLMWFSKYSS